MIPCEIRGILPVTFEDVGFPTPYQQSINLYHY